MGRDHILNLSAPATGICIVLSFFFMQPRGETAGSTKVNSSFWIGISVGAILSLVASITANIMHGTIVGMMESRKLAAQSSRYAKAAKFYKLIQKLRGGQIDKNLYMLRLAVIIVSYVTTTFTSLGAMGVIVALEPSRPSSPAGWAELWRGDTPVFFDVLLRIGLFSFSFLASVTPLSEYF